MGSWATAKLAYGVDLGDKAFDMFIIRNEEENYDYTDYDIGNIYNEWAAFQNGAKHPKDFDNRETPAWKKYNEAAKKFYNDHPFSLVHYGSYGQEGSRYFLALDGTEQSAYQDKASPVNADNANEAIFKAFSEQFNLNLGTPSWAMMASYG
jgi:hypothetical protein